MDDRSRPKWERSRRPPRGTPPRGCWQPAIPSWEKQFCRVIGSIEWGTLLQMKKFIHLYANVVNWDDSAAKEAFFYAKERFWSELHGLPCDKTLPDPNLYIDEINWDSEINIDEIESNYQYDQHHEPVIIFGDSFLPTEAYSGWSDGDDNIKTPPIDQHQQTSKDWDWNYEQVIVPTAAAAGGETRRKQRYRNQFPRSNHRKTACWGQLYSTDKRTDQWV